MRTLRAALACTTPPRSTRACTDSPFWLYGYRKQLQRRQPTSLYRFSTILAVRVGRPAQYDTRRNARTFAPVLHTPGSARGRAHHLARSRRTTAEPPSRLKPSAACRDCFDNAMCESFFASVAYELIDGNGWRTHSEARMTIFKFIEAFENPLHRHSAIGYLSPAEFKRRATARHIAAQPHQSTKTGELQLVPRPLYCHSACPERLAPRFTPS